MPAATIQASKRIPLVTGRSLGSVFRDSFFQYAVNITFTTGTDNFTPVIPIQSDAHFLCVQTMYTNSAQIGNAVATTSTPYIETLSGGAVIQLTDGGDQRFLSNIQVPASTLFGTAKEPYIWPFTHLFRANTFIGVNATGAGAFMAAAVIRLVFAGFKVPLGSFPEYNL